MKGKTILITGGSGGIGAAVASAFVDVGASVIITDIKPPRKSSDQLLFLQADASSEKEVKQVLEHIGREYGGIDILFNNSGVWIPGKTTLQFDGEEFDKVLKINFKSAMWFVKYGIPRMPKKETSCIITSSSIWAEGKLHGALPYAVSKTALVLASRNWAREFAPIRSISIILGGIDTPMLRANPHSKKEIADETLLKRAGTPQEVAETVLYIARNNYITATEIYLDGGSVNR